MSISLKYINNSKKGIEREINKDQIYISNRDEYSLLIVFDGISSSPNAIEAINVIKEFIESNEKRLLIEKDFTLKNLMMEANDNLLSSEITEGCSTYAGLFIDKNDKEKKYTISGLGDTRIYGITKQSLTQLTQDHNLMNTPNVVTRYLGMLEYKHTDFDELIFECDKYSRLLICSDGFYEHIESNKIEVHKILNFKRLGNIKKYLEHLIYKNNLDDATYVLIDIRYV